MAEAPVNQNAVPVPKKSFTKLVHGAVGSSSGVSSCYGHGSRCTNDPAILVPDLVLKPRTAFLQSLAGEYDFNTTDEVLELNKLPNELRADEKVQIAFQAYRNMKGQNARLPKFSKWLNSIYPDFKTLHDAVARAMSGNQSDVLVIGTDAMSLYNGGNTIHFATCLSTSAIVDGKVAQQGTFINTMKRVVSEMDGIAIGYILNRETGFMKGRVWLHHVTHPDYGDAVMLARVYGCLTEEQVAAVFKNKLPNVTLIGKGGYGGVSKKWTFVGYSAPGYAQPGEWHWDTMSIPPDTVFLTNPKNPALVGTKIGY